MKKKGPRSVPDFSRKPPTRPGLVAADPGTSLHQRPREPLAKPKATSPKGGRRGKLDLGVSQRRNVTNRNRRRAAGKWRRARLLRRAALRSHLPRVCRARSRLAHRPGQLARRRHPRSRASVASRTARLDRVPRGSRSLVLLRLRASGRDLDVAAHRRVFRPMAVRVHEPPVPERGRAAHPLRRGQPHRRAQNARGAAITLPPGNPRHGAGMHQGRPPRWHAARHEPRGTHAHRSPITRRRCGSLRLPFGRGPRPGRVHPRHRSRV